MKVSKMLLVVAMMVASTGMKAHATASASSQPVNHVNMVDDPQLNGSAKNCPFATTGQNHTAQDSVVSLNDTSDSIDSKTSARHVAR